MTKGTADQSVNLPSDGLLQARLTLRDEQQKHPTMTGLARLYRDSTLTPALARLGEFRNFHPSTKVPGYVSRGGFTFNPEVEERRIALAEDLIRRTDPGPFEDPNYLALLAYQAASIELVLPRIFDSQKIDWGWSRFLLGTVHSNELNAWSKTLPPQDYTIVVVNSALIEFAYQAAKAVIAVLHPVWSTIPGTTVSFKFTEEHIRDELACNPEPIERLYRTLEAYFFTIGYPRAFYSESLAPKQIIPLGHLIDTVERWVIAHEYGHGFAARMGFKARAHESLGGTAAKAEEYYADDNATMLTVWSAAELDAVGPGVSLAGAAFALACLEVKRRALSVVRRGKVLPDAGDAQHPTNEMRYHNVLRALDFYFEEGPQNKPDSGLDLYLVRRPPDWKPVDSEAKKELHALLNLWANALFLIWDNVRPRLQKDYESKRQLHTMWH